MRYSEMVEVRQDGYSIDGLKVTSMQMTELLDEYIELLDKEFYQMAKFGAASQKLKEDIEDCECRIDIEAKRLCTEIEEMRFEQWMA